LFIKIAERKHNEALEKLKEAKKHPEKWEIYRDAQARCRATKIILKIVREAVLTTKS